MDELDLDSFIANIEQSAPQEQIELDQHLCQECNVALEDIDGTFVCPSCSAQATNILQLEETEMHYDESGRAILGQRVALGKKRPKHTIDYGWAWSTDEAIVHLLSLQVSALEKLGLVPESFRQGIKNMWFKYWIEFVAPHIKDEYNEQDFIPLSARASLKERDVEVLVKVRDKVMIPIKSERPHRQAKQRNYKMLDTYFHRDQPPDDPNSSSDEDETTDPANRSLDRSLEDLNDIPDDEPPIDQDDYDTDKTAPCLTKNLSLNSITILTLNRALAFIEATARSMHLPDPIFASDIVRACNQRTIPFYGAHKTLPEGVRLNQKDKLMFQKTRPPSPVQLTRAATILLSKIYSDKLPFKLPVPNFGVILKRFVIDMNLPLELFHYIRRLQVDFYTFKQTNPPELSRRSIKYPPQYDRWTYAILVGHMKKLFDLSDDSIQAERRLATRQQEETGENIFILQDWVRQMSSRIQLIMSYDPFVMFHPMTDIRNIQPTSQVLKYVESIMSDRVTSTTRDQPVSMRNDASFRSELTEFLKREIPKPAYLGELEPEDAELDRPINVRQPIQDSLTRTSRFWKDKIAKDEEISDLLYQDFTGQKLVRLSRVERWSIFEEGSTNLKHEISPQWPYCFKLLLFVGGFLCHCEPKELVREVKIVEQFLNPPPKRRRARS